MELRRVGQPAVREPETVVEPLSIHNEGVTLPFSDRVSEIERILGVAVGAAGLGPPIEVDEAPILVTGAHHDADALPLPLLEELNAVGNLVDPRARLRLAVGKHRI